MSFSPTGDLSFFPLDKFQLTTPNFCEISYIKDSLNEIEQANTYLHIHKNVNKNLTQILLQMW